MKQLLSKLLAAVVAACTPSYEEARKWEHNDALGIELPRSKTNNN